MKWLMSTVLMLTLFATYIPASNAAVPEQNQLPAQLDWESIPVQFMTEQTANQNNQVQVFDVAKSRVVLSVANSPQFQAEAKKWLADITSLAPEVQPNMKATYIVRVPIEPVQELNVGHIKLKVKEIFLFYYRDTNEEPLLLVFDEEKRPFFFHIHEDVAPFIKQLSIPD